MDCGLHFLLHAVYDRVQPAKKVMGNMEVFDKHALMSRHWT